MSVSTRRRNTGPARETVMTVLARDGFRCVICGKPIWLGERGVDWSLHHRRPRGLGGTSLSNGNYPSNLISVCGSGTTGCHGRIESRRAEAYAAGWLVSLSVADPWQIPCLVERESRWVYLSAVYSDDPVTP